MKRYHDPITGERAFVERHVRGLAGLTTALLMMRGAGGVVSNHVVKSLAEAMCFHAEQLSWALNIEVEEDDPPCG